MTGNAGVQIHVECSSPTAPGLDGDEIATVWISFKFPGASMVVLPIHLTPKDKKGKDAEGKPENGDTAEDAAEKAKAEVDSAEKKGKVSGENRKKIKVKTKKVETKKRDSKTKKVETFVDDYARIEFEGIEEIDAACCHGKVEVEIFGDVTGKNPAVTPKPVTGELNSKPEPACKDAGRLNIWKKDDELPPGPDGWRELALLGYGDRPYGVATVVCGTWPEDPDPVRVRAAWPVVRTSPEDQVACLCAALHRAGIVCSHVGRKFSIFGHAQSSLPVVGFRVSVSLQGMDFPWHWQFWLWNEVVNAPRSWLHEFESQVTIETELLSPHRRESVRVQTFAAPDSRDAISQSATGSGSKLKTLGVSDGAFRVLHGQPLFASFDQSPALPVPDPGSPIGSAPTQVASLPREDTPLLMPAVLRQLAQRAEQRARSAGEFGEDEGP